MEEIFVPASGMALEEVTLVEWLSQPGDEVAPGQAVALVETDKAMVELSGTSGGRLSRHLFDPGTQVQPGATVAYVLQPGESEPGTVDVASSPAAPAAVVASPVEADVEPPTATAGPAEIAPAAASPAEVDVTPPPVTDGQAEVASPVEADVEPPVATAGPPEVRAPHLLSPRQRRAAAAGAAGPAARPDAARREPRPAAGGEGESGEGFRRAIADAVARSWATAPHFAVGREVSAEGLRSALARAKASHPGVTATDFLLLGLAGALQAGRRSGDVGLAVATEWGVIIPVVEDVTGCPVEEIAARRAAAVNRARSRRLASADAATPFATLSNLGPYGVSWFTGIIPLGQTALLTVGEIADRVVASNGGIRIRAQFSATLTADHRHLDGVDSAELLGRFAGIVEAFQQEDVS